MALAETLRFITAHPLNRARPVQALARFAAWQIRSRLAGGDLVVPWVHGARLRVRRGEVGLTGNIYTGLHDFADMAFALHALSPHDLFVDVGANAGAYSVLAAAARGASVVSFEPIPATYLRLVGNLELNGITGRVRALNVGVAGEAGQVTFTADADATNHVAIADDRPGPVITVPVTTLDSALAGVHPAMLKVDVEGFELPVLRGAVRVLADSALYAVLIELNGSGAHYGFADADVAAVLTAAGFAPCAYEPFTRTLTPIDQCHREGNTLFVRNLDTVREIVTRAPAIEVNGLRF